MNAAACKKWVHGCMAAAIASVIACSYRPARFAARPPVEEAADQAPGPLPQTHRILEPLYLTQVYLKRPIMWGLTASRPEYARDVNSFDRVPDSTWYVQRPAGTQIRSSYVALGPPVPPLSAGSVTEDGTLRVRDARGRRYELVLDPHAKPESVTAAGATRRTDAVEAREFYEQIRQVDSGWERTPDPRDAPNEASLRFRRDGADCLFNYYTLASPLNTEAELSVTDAVHLDLGERIYNFLVMCTPAAPAAPRGSPG